MATGNQIAALGAIARGEVRMVKCGTAAFRIFGASPAIVGRCVANGWAKWPKGPVGEQTCEMTASGHTVLDTSR